MSTRKVLMGQFGAAHGLKGEVRLKTFTGEMLAIGDYGPLSSEDGRVFVLTHLRAAKEVLIAKVKGIGDRNAAERLTNLKLYVERDLLGEAEEDAYFHVDLVGLGVEDGEGQRLGCIVALYNFGAGEMVEIRPAAGGRSVLLPFTKVAVPLVDVKVGRVIADRTAFEAALEVGQPEDGEDRD